MLKPIALIAGAVLLLTGCSSDAGDSKGVKGLEAFSTSFTESFDASMKAIKDSDFTYVRQVSGGLSQNNLFKDGAVVTIFEQDKADLTCPFKFDAISSFDKAVNVIPLQPFTPNGKASEILESMSSFSKEATNAEWVTDKKGLYFISEIEEAVNVVAIKIDENKLIEYYMGLTSNDDFATTLQKIVDGVEAQWTAPNLAVFYSYGDKEIVTMSNALPFDVNWYLENHKQLSEDNIYSLATFNGEQVDLTPILTDKGDILLSKNISKEGKQEYEFFNADKTPYQFEGKQLTCSN